MDMEPYEPLHTLKPVAEDIWIVDGPIIDMAYVAGSTLPFPTRMTIVRLADGSLFCHSPTEWTPALADEVEALGPVAHLVSPNKIHYAWIPQWKERYPEATAWASPGVRERAAEQDIEVHFDDDLGDAPPEAWLNEIDQLQFRGSRFMDEIAFFHRASRTLILTDLIENFEPEKVARKWRWLMKLGGVTHPDGKLPLDLRMTFLGHKDIARECYARMRAWRPERIIIAHGRWYEEDAMAELDRAFRWLR